MNVITWIIRSVCAHDGDVTDDNEYAVVEPESVIGFDQDPTQDEIIPTSDYAILDPNETCLKEEYPDARCSHTVVFL
jgi:hypothetical protein